MRPDPLIVGRSRWDLLARGRWGVLALAVTLAAAFFALTSGAEGVVINENLPTTTVGNGPAALQVRMQLLPESLRRVIRRGIAVQLSANERANGVAWLTVSRAMAKRLHIKAGRAQYVVIARGTVAAVKGGTAKLHFRLSRSLGAKLKSLSHATLTLHLSLVGPAHDHLTIDAAGRY